MPSIDFEKIKEQIDLERIFRLLNIPAATRNAVSARGPCPRNCCPDRRCTSYQFNFNCYKCFKCKQGGSPFGLYQNFHRKDFYWCAKELCKDLGIPVPYLKRGKGRKDRKPRIRNKGLSIEDTSVV